jgi:hypothetical protein
MLDKAGRPYKPIDWKRVDELLEAGCTGGEIAPHFNMHHDTFYERVQTDHGVTFTEYADKKRQKGGSLIREKQYKKALKGDNSMLIWLGKNRLGQKDNPDVVQFKDEDVQKFNAIMQMMSDYQAQASQANAQANSQANDHSSALKIADNNINNADK